MNVETINHRAMNGTTALIHAARYDRCDHVREYYEMPYLVDITRAVQRPTMDTQYCTALYYSKIVKRCLTCTNYLELAIYHRDMATLLHIYFPSVLIPCLLAYARA
jgi:hypothetical protein